MKIFDATMSRLERSLDVRLARHNILASNLANVDTPGYTPKDVDFSTAMAKATGAQPTPGALATTHAQHLAGAASAGSAGAISEVDAVPAAPGIDGNRVDLDRTMAALAENALQYGAGTRAASKKLAILRYVVSDGTG